MNIEVTPKTTLASHAAALKYLAMKKALVKLQAPVHVLFTEGCPLTGDPDFQNLPRARKTWACKFSEKILAAYEDRPQWLIVAKN